MKVNTGPMMSEPPQEFPPDEHLPALESEDSEVYKKYSEIIVWAIPKEKYGQNKYENMTIISALKKYLYLMILYGNKSQRYNVKADGTLFKYRLKGDKLIRL